MTEKSSWSLTLKMMVTHTATYLVAGLLASAVFNYAEAFASPPWVSFMRQLDDPIVALGPAVQPVRGLIFAMVLMPFMEVILKQPRGWLYLWGLFVGIGILSTFGAASGSVEGLVYTILPFGPLFGLPEVLAQSLALSFIFVYWANHPEARWLTWLMWIAFVLAIGLPLLGYFAAMS